ncbi:MAG TPA: HNH endonuclease signature motif containing protein [Nocardioides sp.]|nr:HNH endonuclease signature motif containing protein [Nocardioides sp.]
MEAPGPGSTQEALADMSAGDVLSFVESHHAMRLNAERAILRAAYQWAVLHHPDRLPVSDKRGRDRAKPAGATGTPRITEYAAATFGARIQTTPYGAKKLIADAVDLMLRLPKLQAGIETGTVRVPHARHVAAATRDLSPDEAAWVDAEVAESADGRLAWARFEALVEGKVAAANPELTRAKEEAAAKSGFIRMSRVNKHGMATLTIHHHAAKVLTADAGITALAKHLEPQMPDATLAERRLVAFEILTNPDAHHDLDTKAGKKVGPVKPKVKIHLHLTPDSPIARMEGHGPVTTAWVRHLVEHIAAGVRVAPVIDLAGQAPADAYEIPARLREAVRLMFPGDVFPYASSTSGKGDIDHQIPYSQGGPTAIGNLAPLTRGHHRIKTHAGWEARQPFPGIVIWRDPHGAHYLVDHTGTRQVTGNTVGDRRPAPQHVSHAEIYASKILLEYAA